MMKYHYLCVSLAVIVLSSCASIKGHDSINDMVPGDHDNGNSNGGEIDFGKPTENGSMEVEQRELTTDIVSALEFPGAVSVIAFDLLGNPIEYNVRGGEFIDQPVVYPTKASQIGSVYTTTIIWFEGSHCFDRIDSLGNSIRRCTPPH